MISSIKKRGGRAGLLLLVSSVFFQGYALAAPIDDVKVSLREPQGMSVTVQQRITSSIHAIGQRVLVGKEERVFLRNSKEYDTVMADIINRVIVGYVVSDLRIGYGPITTMDVALRPVGERIEEVETDIDFGNLSPAAAALVQKDVEAIPGVMRNLLIGLPIDSVGWAESVTQSAGKELLNRHLPEFEPVFQVEPGATTRVRISLSPQGDIVRRGKLRFRTTTIPRLFMLRATMKAEQEMAGLEGLPVAFLQRRQREISNNIRQMLEKDSFIRKYQIQVDTTLWPGKETVLDVDALTDHWIIRTEAWLDTGRKGNKNTAVRGMLGYFIGQGDILFGEVSLYPGPMNVEVYGGYFHRFKDSIDLGYQYNFNDSHHHVFLIVPFQKDFAIRYDRNFGLKESEFGISYKIHNYMTAEYVYNEEEGQWLRLIANL